MMNLKLTICSWILFFIILSSDTHAAREAVYTGAIVKNDDPLHPSQICRKALNETYVAWAFNGAAEICSSNIKCRKMGRHKERITVTQIPENGVVCGFRTGKPPNIKVCYNKKCIWSAN